MHGEQALVRIAHRKNITATAKEFGLLLEEILLFRAAIVGITWVERHLVADKIIITGEAPKRRQAGFVVTLERRYVGPLARCMAQIVMHGVKPIGKIGLGQVGEQIGFLH